MSDKYFKWMIARYVLLVLGLIFGLVGWSAVSIACFVVWAPIFVYSIYNELKGNWND